MAEGQKVTRPRRGDIYLVSFDPTLGAEIKKTRPALILQNDIANRFSPITIVAADQHPHAIVAVSRQQRPPS